MVENLEEYILKAQATYEAGMKVIQDMSGWNKIETNSTNVVCYRRPNSDSSFDSFKADVFFDRSPAAVANYMIKNWGSLNVELQSDDM